MSYIEDILKQFEEKDMINLCVATFILSTATFAVSLATFVITIVSLSKVSQPSHKVPVEVQEVQVQELEEAEEAEETQEVEETQEHAEEAQEVPPVAHVIRERLYTASEDAYQIITREHNRKREGKHQITAIVRFLHENGPSTKQAIREAMANLGVVYSGGSTQKISYTVKCWLDQPNLHKGCIISN